MLWNVLNLKSPPRIHNIFCESRLRECCEMLWTCRFVHVGTTTYSKSGHANCTVSQGNPEPVLNMLWNLKYLTHSQAVHKMILNSRFKEQKRIETDSKWMLTAAGPILWKIFRMGSIGLSKYFGRSLGLKSRPSKMSATGHTISASWPKVRL